MNLDEQISKRVDKGYRFELWNENVIRFPTRTLYKQKLNKIRTLGTKVLGVFFISNLDEQLDEC